MTRSWAGALAALALLVFVAPASGFGTATTPEFFLNQTSEHERMTRSALACGPDRSARGCFDNGTIDWLAGSPGDMGAVGAPDILIAEDAPAHCDGADYLDTKGYPHSREKATGYLFDCVQYIRDRFQEAVRQAGDVLYGDRDVIRPFDVHFGPERRCENRLAFTTSYPEDARAKCAALLAFGRALHAVQDFYAHSNWSDYNPKKGEVWIQNPPGLQRQPRIAPLPSFLDGSGDTASLELSGDLRDLTTGCYEFDTDDEPDEHNERDSECVDRVRHHWVAKDLGTIEPVYFENGLPLAYSPSTPRGKVRDNFRLAVWSAVLDTRRQWQRLREVLVSDPNPDGTGGYGRIRGNLIACALERDDPTEACQGRDIAIVIDSSSSNTSTDPENRRISAGREFNERLISAADASAPGGKPDRSAVIDFDTSARVASPLSDPSNAKFDSIDSSGGTNIGSGVNLAITELTRNNNHVRDRAGIVVLTDGEDGSPGVLVRALERATELGIRVQFGFLSPPDSPVPPSARRLQAAQSGQPQSVKAAILATGGVFSTINSAEAQAAFLELVDHSGATNLNDANGTDDDGGVSPDLAVTARIADGFDVDRFTYEAPAGRRLKATVHSLDGQQLAVRASSVEDIRKLGPGAQGSSDLLVEGSTRRAGTVAFEVQGVNGATGMYEISLVQEGVDIGPHPQLPSMRACDETPFPVAGEVPRYVLGDDANNHIICGSGHDVIVPGKGSDSVFAGAGDDTIVVGAKDVPKRRTDKVDGNAGKDVLEVAVRRPKRKLRRFEGAILIPVRKGTLRVRNVERIEFTG